MSEGDSGVDSGNESTDPVLLAHRPLRRDDEVDEALSPPIEVQPEQAMDHHESVFIQIDPPEMYEPNPESWVGDQQLTSSQSDNIQNLVCQLYSYLSCFSNYFLGFTQPNNILDQSREIYFALPIATPVIEQCHLPTESSSQQPEPQQAAIELSDPINRPSTSDSNVQVMGFNLRIDQGTINNLNSFYQSATSQHDFRPKAKPKPRKHRVSHYEHLTGMRKKSCHCFITLFLVYNSYKQLKGNYEMQPIQTITKQLFAFWKKASMSTHLMIANGRLYTLHHVMATLLLV